MKRTVLLVAVVVAVAVVGTAVAAFPQDNVKLYTGCLNSGGNITYVKEGDTPLQACSSPKAIVKLSGGDITSLSVTAPLTGGGDNGALTIGLSAAATLPSCSTGDAVPKWNASTNRWTCGTDNDTTYSAGTGLDLSGSTFSIASGYRVKNGPDCTSGEFVDGFASDGTPSCSAPPSSGVHVYNTSVGHVDVGGTAEPTTVASLNLPAGRYLLLGSVTLVNNDSVSAGGYSIGGCEVPGFDTGEEVVRAQASEVVGNDSLSLMSVINHSTDGAVTLGCYEDEADLDVHSASFTAITIDALN